MLVNYQGANGAIEVLSDGFDEYIKIYNDTGAALNNGDNYFLELNIDADDGVIRPVVKACATSAVRRHIVVIDNSPLLKDTIADQAWGFVKSRGLCIKVKANAAITGAAAHLYMQGANGSQEAADDGAAYTADTYAIAVTASGTILDSSVSAGTSALAGYCSAILLGREVTIG